MVEAGQHITDTRTREFGEEALALMDASDEAGRKVRVYSIIFSAFSVVISRCCFSFAFEFVSCYVLLFFALYRTGRHARDFQAIEERLARVFGAEPEPEDFLYAPHAVFVQRDVHFFSAVTRAS